MHPCIKVMLYSTVAVMLIGIVPFLFQFLLSGADWRTVPLIISLRRWRPPMHLTRFGFNSMVLAWLLPALLMDIIGNVNTTGAMSDFYYFKAMFDAVLGAYAFWQLFRGETMSRSAAQQAKHSEHDTVVNFENLGSLEYIYCAVLAILALGSWWFHHDINKNSTGLLAIATLVWSWLDIAIVIVSGVQFWHLKSGAIVNVSRKFVEH